MSRDPELLRVEFLGITVRHEEVELGRHDLALHFADMGERHGLTRFEFLDAGATLSGPEGAELVLRPGQIGACGVSNLGYREGLERVLGAVAECVERFGVGRMWAEDITLVAVAGYEASRALQMDASLKAARRPGQTQAQRGARPGGKQGSQRPGGNPASRPAPKPARSAGQGGKDHRGHSGQRGQRAV